MRCPKSVARRAFLQLSGAAATVAGSGLGYWAQLAAQDRFDQEALLAFDPVGTVTLMHMSDLNGQMTPLFHREPQVSVGVGKENGKIPHLTGEDFRIRYGVGGSTPMDYALTHENFALLADAYGPMGGLDRAATVLNAIRAERPGALFLDGGSAWHGSLGSLRTQGQDMISVMDALAPDAKALNNEVLLGRDRLTEAVRALPYPVVAQNVRDEARDMPASLFAPYTMFERGGTLVAVIGQANPQIAARYPGALFPDLSFGMREGYMQQIVAEVRGKGAGLVVCLSQNGFAADRKMAQRVVGIDVILSGGSHHVLPEPVMVGQTALVASGAHGKFISRVDIDVENGTVRDLAHRLIPVFSELIAPDQSVGALIDAQRAPFRGDLNHVAGVSAGLLYRTGTLTSSWDRLMCDALMAEHDAQIALSSGHRWGASVLPGALITREAIYGVTATPYPCTAVSEMTGAALKDLLEDAAEGVFATDPYARSGQDMMHVGGVGYRLDATLTKGGRILDLALLADDQPIDPARTYRVAEWGRPVEAGDGPPIWDVVERHVGRFANAVPVSAATVELVQPKP